MNFGIFLLKYFSRQTSRLNFGLSGLAEVLSISIALCKALFSTKKYLYFSYFSTKTYVVGTHQEHLGKSLLMSTNNICFHLEIRKLLTLKTSRKPESENVVCLCRLLYILAIISNLFRIQANSVDPDQTAPRGAVWSGSTLFAKMTF